MTPVYGVEHPVIERFHLCKLAALRGVENGAAMVRIDEGRILRIVVTDNEVPRKADSAHLFGQPPCNFDIDH